MIDAEHTYFQPAIDNITTDLIKKFNREYPVIFSTYQMYLKDSSHRLLIDAERAKKGNYCFAAKLVRGAYMVLESARALTMKYDNPIHDSLHDTHNNYNGAVKMLISSIAAGNRVEVMIATHNQHSVELALHAMEDNALPPTSSVYFGQLLGKSLSYYHCCNEVPNSSAVWVHCFLRLCLFFRYERQHDIHAWSCWIQGIQICSVRQGARGHALLDTTRTGKLRRSQWGKGRIKDNGCRAEKKSSEDAALELTDIHINFML